MPRAERKAATTVTGPFGAIRAELVADLARLEAERETVLAGLADVLRDSAAGSGDDPADSSGKTFGREHEQALLTRVTDAVQATRDALDRMAAGTYGVCESCGEPIALPRLEAFPRAALCVACKQRQERR
ncbi:TraR/DksA C4-type zinc finger protein [Kineosporia sp. J2-2]|uniref:TraR/DksA C4-type zinc finger protein n=1 Tax=Kineosporia corallincola TaxID=2835133 RepID=A0ABS5TJ13_9ACTN|nr:TraR/DksA C4-type zinc finger protein [Kineosporia corallincola]MBT0771093.1 TraR/DksA C4-type zinc finger protein [Kineosporia corallincola]